MFTLGGSPAPNKPREDDIHQRNRLEDTCQQNKHLSFIIQQRNISTDHPNEKNSHTLNSKWYFRHRLIQIIFIFGLICYYTDFSNDMIN